MTDTNISLTRNPPTRLPALRYLSSLRPGDILALQGPPLIGAVFALGHLRVHHLAPLAMLFLGNIFLIAHVFLLNDWGNADFDLSDPTRASRVFSTRGLASEKIAVLSLALLTAALAFFCCLGTTPVAMSFGIVLLSALYSLPPFDWKGKPLLNSAAHVVGGILHFLLGYSLGHLIDGRGLAIAAFFGLVFAGGHLTQETRDSAGDARNGVRTNAVVFGARRTFGVSLILFAVAHLVFLLLACRGIIPHSLAAIALLFPLQLYWSFATLHQGLTYESVARLQARYRALYALIGVVIVAAVW